MASVAVSVCEFALSPESLPDSARAAVDLYGIADTVVIVAFILFWSFQAMRARVLSKYPAILKVGRAALIAGGAFPVFFVLERLDQAEVLKVPVFTRVVAASRQTGLQTFWFVGEFWGIGGLVAMRKTRAVDSETVFIDSRLSARELEIVRLVTQVKSNKEISQPLDISCHTFKNHNSNIFRKSGVGSRYEMIRFSRQKGK